MTTYAGVHYQHISSEGHCFIAFQDHKQMFSILYFTVTLERSGKSVKVTYLCKISTFIWNVEQTNVKHRERWQRYSPKHKDLHFIFYGDLRQHFEQLFGNSMW